MRISLFGTNSSISQYISNHYSENNSGNIINNYNRKNLDFRNISSSDLEKKLSLTDDYYIFCVGLLHPKRLIEQSDIEITESINVNLISIVKICDYLLEKNSKAKIIIVGSESGRKGSYDTTYFLSKSALRSYVYERHISSPEQQILLISPSVIEDAGMTTRRTDTENIVSNTEQHPKKRLLKSVEVANLIISIINNKFDYISNTEIEINGGKFARMKY